MSNRNLNLTLKFNADNKEFLGQVKASSSAVNQLGDKSRHTGSEFNNLTKNSSYVETRFSSLKAHTLGLVSGLSALAVAINAKNTLGQYQDMRTQITALVGGQEEWLQTEQYLNQVAEEHNKTVADLSGSYARLLTLQNGGLITQQQVTSIFEGMSNAASANGATNEHLSNTMYGLQQAMASGTVRAEEFNQVTESMPDLLIKLAESADTTVGGLRNMVNSGKMTSELFGELLVKALEKYDGAAARTVDNIRAQENAFSRAYQDMVLAFEKPISNVFSDSVSASTSVLKVFSDNAELITNLVGAAMFAALGRGATAVASMTQVKIRDIAADRQKIVAEQQKNVVELASIQSEIRHLEVMRATNAQRFAATGAVNALAAAEAREKVLKDALAASQARLNVVMRAGTGLMALLGGPAGVAMMAAGAISYFALTSSDAKTKTDSFSESIESLLGQMSKLEEQRLTKGLEERLKALKNVELQIETISRRKGTEDIQKRLVELAKLRTAEQTLKQEIVDIEDKIYEVRSRPSPDNKNSPTSEQEEAAKAGERLLATLSRQAALYGQTSEVAKVRYEIEKGSLQGINDQLKEQLLLQARIIDQKRAEAEKVKSEKKTDKIDDFYASSDQINNDYMMRLAIQADYENKAKIQEQYAYAERQNQIKAKFDAAYTQAQGNQELMNSLELEYFQNRQILHQEHEMNLTEITRQGTRERDQLLMQNASFALGASAQMFDGLSALAKTYQGEQSSAYRTLFAISKGFAVAQAGLNLYTAISNATTTQPWYLAAANIATAASQGAMILAGLKGSNYQGQAHDGIDRVPQANEGTWLLKANEMVLNPAQADNFRWMVSAMRDMKAMFSSMTSSSAGSASSSREKPINVHVHGVDKERVRTSASENGGEINIEVVIDQAVNRSLQAVYNDFDNGGPISMRSKAN
ncbi:tape measure protein [Vibrio furnissii]|uniref:tape measure protein n=1 Tax=Vibrio furnissii TaxID=29494 RepID=UPI002572509F|nr:tape measure protein [Vibrio furnissii]WJG24288.1 tape measure protein [Vibrio furnissii]